MNHALPIIDFENPLYCPAFTASSFYNSILAKHNNRRKSQTRDPRLLQSSFAEALIQSEFPPSLDPTTIRRSSLPVVPSSSPSRDSWIAPWNRPPTSNIPRKPLFGPNYKHLNTKRKRRAKYNRPMHRHSVTHARSSGSFDDASFDVILQSESLRYPPLHTITESSPVAQARSSLPDTISGEIAELTTKLEVLEVCEENFSDITDKLNLLFPGIRLKDELNKIKDHTSQGVVDYLSNAGLLNSQVLTIFSKASITSLTLSNSLSRKDGLNLNPLLSIFSLPQRFTHLTVLSLADAAIDSFDLVHVARLSNLSTLSLSNTSVTNEAIYLLIPLKETLTELSVAFNPDIDDDSVPAVLLLYKLTELSIFHTGIGMIGLRRFAKTVYEDCRVIDVAIPMLCETYVDNIQSMYLWDPHPPLITKPTMCFSLSSAALQRNLEAHARVNPAILTGGSRTEMAERLYTILQTREMDMIVCDMVQSGDSTNDP